MISKSLDQSVAGGKEGSGYSWLIRHIRLGSDPTRLPAVGLWKNLDIWDKSPVTELRYPDIGGLFFPQGIGHLWMHSTQCRRTEEPMLHGANAAQRRMHPGGFGSWCKTMCHQKEGPVS